MTVTTSRRGACPTLTAPMRTGDGLLARLSPASPSLTPAQLGGLGECAWRYGNGIVQITSRGSLQIRGLTAPSAARLAREVDQLGIAVHTGVQVDIGPLAGLDPGEIADSQALAQAIRAGIAAAGLSARLAPKVSVVVDGGGTLNLRAMAADVRLEAVRGEPGPRWRLAIGGTAESATPFEELDEEDAALAALALLEKIAARGPAARGKDIVNTQVDSSAFAPSRIASIAGIVAGVTAQAPDRAIQVSGHAAHGSSADIAIRLADSRHAVPIALPFGSVSASAFASLADAAKDLGVTEFRFAPGHVLIGIVPTPDHVPTLRQCANDLGFVTDLNDHRLLIEACTGIPGCAYALIQTHQIADELAANSDIVTAAGRIHISGCRKGCAHPDPAPLTLVGDENGIGIVVNGTTRDMPCIYLSPAQAVARLAALSRVGLARLAAELNRNLA